MKKTATVEFATKHRCGPKTSRITLTPRPTMTVAFQAKAPACCFASSVAPPSNLTKSNIGCQALEWLRSCSVCRGNALPSAASFCIHNFWTTSCCMCQTHVSKRASNSSTRTLQKRGFDFRFLRFRSSVLRVGRARNFFCNQARQLGMGQRPALQCGAVGTCCLRRLDVQQMFFLRCRRGDQLLQIFKLSHVQLRAFGVRGQDKAWFVLAADLFNIRSICRGTRTWRKFANLPSPN